MPEISRFFGIIIRMYFDDHPPPHFHAIYGDSEAQVGIDPIAILESNLPRRAISMVVEWATLHQNELMANWQRLREDQPAEKIPPLDCGRFTCFQELHTFGTSKTIGWS
jgi:hypothetical protein